MNTDIKTHRVWFTGLTRDLLVLIALSSLTFIAQEIFEWVFESRFLFSLHHQRSGETLYRLGALPIFCAAVVALKRAVASLTIFAQQKILVLSYLMIFFILSPHLEFSVVFFLGILGVYVLERVVPRQGKLQFVFFGLLGIVLLYFPVALYTLKTQLPPPLFYLLLLFKTCVMMRIISWIIDRRLYKRAEYSTLVDYLEFILCPIFFVFPGQIQYFLFSHFHRSKGPVSDDTTSLKTFLIGVWGIGLMLLYSGADMFFWTQVHPNAQATSNVSFFAIHFGFGLFWLVVIYFQQAGGMAYQVCLGRVLGYQIKYDMHAPLAARSPIDYLRRHSSYARDYIIEGGFRPISLQLLRRGWSPGSGAFYAAVFSYGIFVMAQTGYRADYNRPWPMSLAMLASLIVFLLLPFIGSFMGSFFGPATTIVSPLETKPLRLWRTRDYLFWIGTIVTLAISKAVLGLARVFNH